MSRFIWFAVLASTLFGASSLPQAERLNHLPLQNPKISQKEWFARVAIKTEAITASLSRHLST